MGDVVGMTERESEVQARMLIRAGWRPRVRNDITIWRRPSSGFWYAQEVAVALVERSLVKAEAEEGDR